MRKVILACIFVFTIYGIYSFQHNNKDKDTFYISAGNDSAGLLLHAAVQNLDAFAFTENTVSLYPISDCCGTKSAWALSAEHVAMSVMCPDAAADYLAKNSAYTVICPVIYNAEVLVSTTPDFYRVGYMQGRERHRRLLAEAYGDKIELIPIQYTALPYALETGEIDAAFLDAFNAVQLDYQITPLENPEPSYVLVAKKEFAGSEAYTEFLDAFNTAVDNLANPENLYTALAQFSNREFQREEVKKWEQMKVLYHKISS